MRRAIWIALLIAVALVFLHDVSRWVNTQSRLNESTTQLANWATEVVRPLSRDAGAQIVTAEGAKRGVRVYQYDQDQDTLMIWGAADVPGTWVIGPYRAIMKGIPIGQALGMPFVVKSYHEAQLQ
jgi:hypothetical protein